MKKWLRKKLLNIIQSPDEGQANMLGSPEKYPTISKAEDSVQDDPVLNFKVFNAVGGKVVEFRRYDRRTDRSNCTTYIITNEQDFGERISKIATMENLKS